MKAKHLLVILVTLVFVGCDDNTGGLGIGSLPESDLITVDTEKFTVKTSSTLSGPVYAKTSTGYVGRFTDKEYGFGYYEGSFLTELNCIDDLTFPKPYDPVTNRNEINMAGDLDEAFEHARLELYCTSFFGDSLSPIQVGVYELGQKLDKNHKTDIKPADYLKDPNKPLGRSTFSVVNLADSARTAGSYAAVIPLPDEFGKELIRHNWDKPGDFKDSETFIENVFKGIYLKNETGDGTVLYVDQVVLYVRFKAYVLDSLGNTIKKHDESGDSLVWPYRSFASTKEVIQANEIIISDEVADKANEKDWTYLKSPAGIFTKATLPIGDIVRGLQLDRDTINAVKLALTAYHHETENEYSMSPPSKVLLIKEKDADEFFEKNKLPDNISSYTANYTASTNQYTFSNLTRLTTALISEMKEAQKKAEDEGTAWDEAAWLEENAVSIIPVVGDESSNIQHDLKPAFVKLKGGEDGPLIDLDVVYSRFYKKD